jgi:ATP-dependent DNA helicase DinG
MPKRAPKRAIIDATPALTPGDDSPAVGTVTASPAPALPIDVAACFATDGPLAVLIPGYEARKGQVALAELMAKAITTKQPMIAEAATGVGKSLSYLVTLAAKGQKAIIATHTKALQQQLWDVDIPRLQQMFPHVTAAVLKGRQNFACKLEMDKLTRNQRESDLFRSSATAKEYQELNNWLVTDGQHGDLDQLPFGISDELRMAVTVDGYSCVGKSCPFHRTCYSQQAKERAQTAQLVIVNHSILMLDLMLGKTAGLLPAHPVVVLDEAQHLEPVATDTFGAELGAGRWNVIRRRVAHLGDELIKRWAGEMDHAASLEAIREAQSQAVSVTEHADHWFNQLLDRMGPSKMRPLDGVIVSEELWAMGQTLSGGTTQLGREIGSIAERLKSALTDDDLLDAERWEKLRELCERTTQWLDLALADAKDDVKPLVRFIEQEEGRTKRAYVKVKPVRVDDILEQYLWSKRTVLAVSATLATGKSSYRESDPFTYWRDRVGVTGGLSAVIPSPFPFKTATRLFLPANAHAFVPPPGGRSSANQEAQEVYRAQLFDTIEQLLAVRTGGAFVLFTAFDAMRACAAHLRDALTADTLYLQGDAPPAELVRRFKADGHGVLLGTRTFWEGIDVPGEALSMVIIDKLPFGVPDDPLWKARCLDVGEGWFMELALPMTMMALKQAAGRLMRRMDDRGIVAILDGRMLQKAYGKWLISGLPPSPIVGEVAQVKEFFNVQP